MNWLLYDFITRAKSYSCSTHRQLPDPFFFFLPFFPPKKKKKAKSNKRSNREHGENFNTTSMWKETNKTNKRNRTRHKIFCKIIKLYRIGPGSPGRVGQETKQRILLPRGHASPIYHCFAFPFSSNPSCLITNQSWAQRSQSTMPSLSRLDIVLLLLICVGVSSFCVNDRRVCIGCIVRSFGFVCEISS